MFATFVLLYGFMINYYFYDLPITFYCFAPKHSFSIFASEVNGFAAWHQSEAENIHMHQSHFSEMNHDLAKNSF